MIKFISTNVNLSDQQIQVQDASCIIKVELSPFNLLYNEYDNFLLRDKVWEKNSAQTLSLFSQSMIVNQTKSDIQIKTTVDEGMIKTVVIRGG